MSHRHEWQFRYPATRIEQAARAKLEHHAERLTVWQRERGEAEEKLKAEGMTFRQLTVTGGARVEAVLDPALQARVNECAQKIDEHQRLHDEYATYVRALEANPEALLTLDVQDLAFFGM